MGDFGGSGFGSVIEVTGRPCFLTGYLPSAEHNEKQLYCTGKIVYKTHLQCYIKGHDFSNTARWAKVEFVPIDCIEERQSYIKGYVFLNTKRFCLIIPDTRTKQCFIYGKPDKPPCIAKYPRYYTWEKIPRTFYLDCQIVSYAEIDWETLLVYVTTNKGYYDEFTIHTMKNGLKTTEYELVFSKNNVWVYNLKVHFFHVFEENEKVEVKIFLADVFGNILKETFC